MLYVLQKVDLNCPFLSHRVWGRRSPYKINNFRGILKSFHPFLKDSNNSVQNWLQYGALPKSQQNCHISSTIWIDSETTCATRNHIPPEICCVQLPSIYDDTLSHSSKRTVAALYQHARHWLRAARHTGLSEKWAEHIIN